MNTLGKTKIPALSLSLSLISGLCLWLYMARFEAEMSGGPRSAVLIATRDISMGETLTEDMLGLRNVPQAYLEPRHISVEELSAVLGARMSMSVNAGESVLWSDLASMQNERRDLSGLIDPGMRALTVPASAQSLFGGLLRPGDRVDVLYTAAGSFDGPGSTVTLLQNVLVLAVGADMGSPGSRGKAGSVVTVSVSPEQAQAVVHARTKGALDVALRNPDDTLVLEGLPDTQTSALQQAEERARLSQRVAQTRQGIDHVH